MRNRLAILLALLGLTSVACASEDTERVAPAARATPRPGESAPSVPEPAVPQAGTPGDPSVPPALDPGGAAQVGVPGATGTVQNTHSMEEVGRAIEAAIAAAAALPANGDDTCAVSYRGLEAMLAELQRAMPDQPTNPLPLRDQYLEVCRDMPDEVQQCLLISHAIEHQAECERVTANLDPALRARVEAMMQSGEAPAP